MSIWAALGVAAFMFVTGWWLHKKVRRDFMERIEDEEDEYDQSDWGV